jgi:putative transposase
MELLDLETARLREAERRLRLLGDCAHGPYNYDQLLDRARTTYTSVRVLKHWRQTYQSKGKVGLKPDEWGELDAPSQCQMMERYKQLGDIAEAESVSPDQIDQVAQRNRWNYRQAERWLRRYRVGGLWALAPQGNPDKPRRSKNLRRPLATLSEHELKQVYRRRDILGDLADKASVSEAEARSRAQEKSISLRTFWNYLRDYRQSGLAGLAPRRRSDEGKRHCITDRMEQIIVGLRLSKPDLRVRAVYTAACEKARQLGEPEPTEWQVRDICDKLPEPVKLLADGREDDFRDKYRFTYRMRFDGSRLIYQFDHTPIDVLVKDLRAPQYRTLSGEIRPWLTLGIDSSSRLVMAARFGYDHPDRFTVAAAIRDALLVSDQKLYGGKPDEIWVDNGKELISGHVWRFTSEAGITLQPCEPHEPQIRGIGERFFETLNVRLWSLLPGYVNSNVAKRNPKVRAELALSEVVAEFWNFVSRYHNEIHSETGQTPLAYWAEHCYAEPLDPRQLDFLLKELHRRKVSKEGISYAGRMYWHTALSAWVGQSVLIRVEPNYAPPDEIEVFHQEGSQSWICTAFAIDSATGQAVTRQQVASAQREQRVLVRQTIKQARAALQEVEQEIEEKEERPTAAPPLPPATSTDRPRRAPSSTSSKKPRPDLLDRMAGLDRQDATV